MKRSWCGWAASMILAGVGTGAAWEPPVERPARVVVERGFGEYQIELDLSRSVLSVEMPDDREFGNQQGKTEPLLTAVPAKGNGLVSASELAWKAKQFDDGLYAAVELAAEGGQGKLGSKAELLRTLAQALEGRDAAALGNAPGILYGATTLGRLGVKVPQKFAQPVDEALKGFLGSDLRSKPLAFYAWSDALKAIFQQDRMLQSELKGAGGIEALVAALRSDAKARATYEGYLSLVGKLTNPLLSGDLRGLLASEGPGSVPEGGVSVFPASRSHEGELVKRLYGDRPIPDGFDLASELIRQVRAGTIELKPTADSGWYDYQTYALEPLIRPEAMPEAAHLAFDPGYVKQLEELFRGLLTLTRETHVKQLEIPAPGAALSPQVEISPELMGEPLVTHYQRRAEAYAFIRNVLEESFGEDGLKAMHRLTANGPVEPDLASELGLMEGIHSGMAQRIGRQIGMDMTGKEADERLLTTWLQTRDQDRDLVGDARVMVPVFYDRGRKLTKAWVVLGWTERPLRVSYAKAPEVLSIKKNGKAVEAGSVQIGYDTLYAQVSYPVTAEVYVSKVLNRAEFQALCDKHKTASGILGALK